MEVPYHLLTEEESQPNEMNELDFGKELIRQREKREKFKNMSNYTIGDKAKNSFLKFKFVYNMLLII